jgi:hypothetical protein
MQPPELNTSFVISPFGEPFDSYFIQIIKPALDECGLYAVRGDSLYRPTTIVDDIWQGIKDAKLLIAELTDRNPNVFYELGLAHALSKPVILISKSIDDVPFDLRSIRVLVYDKDHPDWGNKLRTSLVKSIKEVLINPLSAIPSTFKVAVKSQAPEESETLIRLDELESIVQRMSSNFEMSSAPEPKTHEKLDALTKTPLILKPEQIVAHEKFGFGTVISVEYGKHARAHINFEKSGIKVLDLSVAKLLAL